jgi:lysophospholipase L1-like esterase
MGLFLFFYLNIPQKVERRVLVVNTTRDYHGGEPKTIQINGKAKVKYPEDYTTVLVGDSMTEKLGNCDELRAYLKKYFPDKSFALLNYGFGSTNILSVEERLTKETQHGRSFRPILDIAFDVILIESFGHNPLSQFPLEEGLKKQTEALDKIVSIIRQGNPEAKIVFVGTIAPNKKRYGEGLVTLSPEKRAQWADERSAYIKNHLEYAKSHNIPSINIYEKSLNGNDGGNLDYINSADFIHPSPNGVYFISGEIGKALSEQKIIQP